jgi:hypothetical protein
MGVRLYAPEKIKLWRQDSSPGNGVPFGMQRILCSTAILLIMLGARLNAQPSASQHFGQDTSIDSDQDGLSDDLEQALLEQYKPLFMVSQTDCSDVPAEFIPENRNPTVLAEDATIYGQVFPGKSQGATEPMIEIHYYHLWKKDCGRMGHTLDTEHVAVLIRASGTKSNSGTSKASYWYAAAHEDTLCDASQISRASTLHAEDHGATVWISVGKHASFLNEELCRHGCGGDLCEKMTPLSVSRIVNLGEIGMPMNGAIWISSSRWPLTTKMARTDFQPAAVSRLENLSQSGIAWVNPAKRPAQSTIAAGDSTIDALVASNQNTGTAISTAGDATGNALDRSYGKVRRALGTSAHGVGKFLGRTGAQ